MEAVLLFATLIAPIILALVEVVKKTVNVKVNLLPVIALVLGLLVGFVAQPFTDLDLVLRLWAGGLAGLTATGMFELVTNRFGTTKGGKY